MGILDKLFGKKKPKNTPSESIQKLQDTLFLLERREKHLQDRIDMQLQIAKVNVQKNKKAALFALKKKKMFEVQLEKLSGARFTIENQIMAMEQLVTNRDAMTAMKEGAETMKAMHGGLKVEDVDRVMDNITDEMEVANEITNALSQNIGMGIDIDEDELNAELDELVMRDLDERMLDTAPRALPRPAAPPVAPPTPQVPAAGRSPPTQADPELVLEPVLEGDQ